MSIDIRILDRHPRIFSIELNRYPGCRSASGSRSISSLAGRADRSRFDEISELPSTKIDLKIHILEFFKYISHIKIYLKNSKKILEKFQNPKYITYFFWKTPKSIFIFWEDQHKTHSDRLDRPESRILRVVLIESSYTKSNRGVITLPIRSSLPKVEVEMVWPLDHHMHLICVKT